MERIAANGNEVLNFEGFNKRIGYRWPPPKMGEISQMVQTGIGMVSKYDDAVVKARSNSNLSAAGRMEQVQPVLDKAKQDIADRLSRTQVEQERIDKARAALFDPPALDPTNAVEAIRDTEIRSRFAELGMTQQGQSMRDTLQQGKNDRVLFALMRDPFDTPDARYARSVWEDRITKTKKAELAALEGDEEMVDWAYSILIALQSLLDHNAFGLSSSRSDPGGPVRTPAPSILQ